LAGTPDDKADDTALVSAVCPVVYRLDGSASSRGYHYAFFGNAFFINEQGYLLTVAHVLETFRDGGQPYVLVRRPNSPPRLLQAAIVAVDSAHDLAILRATPNPFAGKYRVTALALARDAATRGQPVLALSLHPSRPQDAQSFEVPREDRSAGEVLSYESTQLDKSAAPSEVFLLSHAVAHGQSGSPVLARDSQSVVGVIEGRWLRGRGVSNAKSSGQPDTASGVAIPIRYAISLLQQKGIAWRSAPDQVPHEEPAAKP
jgi:hypothetical protein